MSQGTVSTFRNVVPRGVKIAAGVLVGATLLAVLLWIFAAGVSDGRANRASNDSAMPEIAIASVVVSVFIAAVLLALGYVYGDSKRRGMHAALWTLIVALTPNLIGFLLYLALRRPLLAACHNCGAGVLPNQRFCSACGLEQSISGTPTPSSTPPVNPSAAPRSGLSLKSFAVGFSVWTGIFLSKSLFAYLKHDTLDSAVLFGFAAIGLLLIIFAHQKPSATRA